MPDYVPHGATDEDLYGALVEPKDHVFTARDFCGEERPAGTITISVYLDDGMVFEYDLPASAKWQAREHVSAIIAGGYRSVRDGVLTHYPPHRLLKVKASGQSTSYPDRVRGT